MQCPYCGSDSSVVDSRSVGEGVRRRRVCSQCRRRFTTYERVAPPSIKVVKRSGKSEPFDPTKIQRVLERVGRGRPGLDDDDIRRLTAAIEAELIDERVKSIPSAVLVERLLQRLRDIDRVAYSRLAADYVDASGQLRTSLPRGEDDKQLGLFEGGDRPSDSRTDDESDK